MFRQWDHSKDFDLRCRFVALVRILTAALMRGSFMILIGQKSGFTEIENGFGGVGVNYCTSVPVQEFFGYETHAFSFVKF